jgi:hypothetical protein
LTSGTLHKPGAAIWSAPLVSLHRVRHNRFQQGFGMPRPAKRLGIPAKEHFLDA